MEKDLQLEKVIGETLEKSLPEIVDVVTEKKINELMSKQVTELEDIKQEIKKLRKNSNNNNPEVLEAFQKTAIVGIFKEVYNGNVQSKDVFNDIVEKNVKAMNTSTATEGAEFVFAQFQKDIQAVFDEFELVGKCYNLTIGSGNDLTVPKETGEITTYSKRELAELTASQLTTGDLNFKVVRHTTLTQMSEEMLTDTLTVPSLYDHLVRRIAESQARYKESKFFSGVYDGVDNGIEGILTVSGMAEEVLGTAETIEDITEETILNAIGKVEGKYTLGGGMAYIMSRYTKYKLMAKRDINGFREFPDLKNNRILGEPVIISTECPVQNATQDIAGATPIVYGNMKHYWFVNRQALNVERGLADGDFVRYRQSVRSGLRVAGRLMWKEAFVKITNGSAS